MQEKSSARFVEVLCEAQLIGFEAPNRLNSAYRLESGSGQPLTMLPSGSPVKLYFRVSGKFLEKGAS